MMRVLLLIQGFNALSQRLFIELKAMGHEVTIEFDINDQNTISAIELFGPDVILAPYLKRAIPEVVWRNHLCLIVHPGPMGDRGPSAIDWAILKEQAEWGVTVLQAEAEMDAGPVWDTQKFAMPLATKSSLYRNEVTEAAVVAVKNCLVHLAAEGFNPRTLSQQNNGVAGQLQPNVKQADRKIDWIEDTTEMVLRKIRSADGVPGVRDEIFGRELFLYDAHRADGFPGNPGEIVAISGPAICRTTKDGAIWVGHLRDKTSLHPFKLPATMVLTEHIGDLPQIPIDTNKGYHEIEYSECDGIGHLRFDFYNGAMSTAQCERLLTAYRQALRQKTKAVVLHGGNDFWSNGMHLNLIEASHSPANESWRNINAIDDLAEEIIRTCSHITIAALHGNAGAGGVFLARACDYVWLRKGIILNPHYKDMGNLYGSEYWTYLLPRYAGPENARRISAQRLPMSADEAVNMGIGDLCFGETRPEFEAELASRAVALSRQRIFENLIARKIERRDVDELAKPLAVYRSAELLKMKQNFFGFDPSYHVARYNFVHKIAKSRTPITLARHRDQRYQAVERKVS